MKCYYNDYNDDLSWKKKKRSWMLSFLLCLMFCPSIAFSSSGTTAVIQSATTTMAKRRMSFVPTTTMIGQQKEETKSRRTNNNHSNNIHIMIAQLRGGQVEDDTTTTSTTTNLVDDNNDDVVEEEAVIMMEEFTVEEKEEEVVPATAEASVGTTVSSSMLSPVTGALQSFGSAYASSLNARPIVTKSVTACFIFALSDYFAQRLEGNPPVPEPEIKKKNKKNAVPVPVPVVRYNWVRTWTSAAVGLLYFGPAAHAWYESIFKLLPGTSLVSTLQKAALGQLIFGPSFTCVFFATSLLQAGEFTFVNWFRKIKNDLPAAWAAGLGFWPLVDLISYSYIPSQWIPLFINFCSFLWTIYLSTVANRSPPPSSSN